jgi:O-antigen/teichoic acid export membrane protein
MKTGLIMTYVINSVLLLTLTNRLLLFGAARRIEMEVIDLHCRRNMPSCLFPDIERSNMAPVNWHEIWQHSSGNPLIAAAFALLTLNGLSLKQIQALEVGQIDYQTGWLMTSDGLRYPLVSQAAQLLAVLPDVPRPFATSEAEAALREFAPLESAAHRRLAGAIWYTSDEGRALMEFAEISEAPILPLRFMFPFSIAERLAQSPEPDMLTTSHQVLQSAADWLFEESFAPRRSISTRVLNALQDGRSVFVVVSLGVSALNLLHNIIMGRLLTPADYGQLTLIITLQLLIGLLPSALQTVVARFTARYHAQDNLALLMALRTAARRIAWGSGIALAVAGILLSPLLVTLFHLEHIWLLIPNLLVVPLFIAMSIDRGLLQGLDGFWWLSPAYASEAVIRLGVGVLLVLANTGRGLEGAVWAVAESVVVTWLISWLAVRHFRATQVESQPVASTERQAWLHLAGVTLMALVGQALITSSDFLLVKNFFSPQDAGLYAAVSVMGRIVYFGALPLTILLVPLIARRQALNEPTRSILYLLIGGGTAACGTLLVISLLFAPAILRLMYGEPYVPAAGLLPAYGLAASLYTLTNLMVSYRIALGRGSESWMPLLAGIIQIIAILMFHETLEQVILVQIVLMAVLCGAVAVQIVRSGRHPDVTESVLVVAGIE